MSVVGSEVETETPRPSPNSVQRRHAFRTERRKSDHRGTCSMDVEDPPRGVVVSSSSHSCIGDRRFKEVRIAGDETEKEKVPRCNSAGSIYSLASFLKPGMYEDGSGSPAVVDGGESMDAKPEVVGGWALSLKNLLMDPNGVALFLKYCTQLLCDENLLFWQAVQEFKTCEETEQIELSGKSIFNDFIHHTGKHQVNLNSKTSKTVKAAIKEPFTNELYDACQTEIFQLMKTDSYRKFLQSEMYKEVLCLELEGKRLPWEESDEPATQSRKKGFLSFLRKDKRKSQCSTLPPFQDDKKAFDTCSSVSESLGRDKKFHIRTKSSASALREQLNAQATDKSDSPLCK